MHALGPKSARSAACTAHHTVQRYEKNDSHACLPSDCVQAFVRGPPTARYIMQQARKATQTLQTLGPKPGYETKLQASSQDCRQKRLHRPTRARLLTWSRMRMVMGSDPSPPPPPLDPLVSSFVSDMIAMRLVCRGEKVVGESRVGDAPRSKGSSKEDSLMEQASIHLHESAGSSWRDPKNGVSSKARARSCVGVVSAVRVWLGHARFWKFEESSFGRFKQESFSDVIMVVGGG